MYSCERCTYWYQVRRAHQFQQAQESPIQGSGSALVRSPAPLEPVTPPKATGMAYFIQQPMSSTVQGAGSASSGSGSVQGAGSASSSGDMATGSTSASSGSGPLMDVDLELGLL